MLRFMWWRVRGVCWKRKFGLCEEYWNFYINSSWSLKLNLLERYFRWRCCVFFIVDVFKILGVVFLGFIVFWFLKIWWNVVVVFIRFLCVDNWVCVNFKRFGKIIIVVVVIMCYFFWRGCEKYVRYNFLMSC